VLRDLKTLNSTWFCKISDRSKKGIPDVILCVNGNFVAMELKRSNKEKATPLQKHTLDEIYQSGGCAWEVNPENWDVMLECLKQLAGEKND
jgi:hypothetical protein